MVLDYIPKCHKHCMGRNRKHDVTSIYAVFFPFFLKNCTFKVDKKVRQLQKEPYTELWLANFGRLHKAFVFFLPLTIQLDIKTF